MSAKNDDTVYRKLQEYLDSLPIDYPETESGVEIRILKSLFTPQEAEIALKLKIIPQEARALFRPFKKKGWTLDQFSKVLLTMAKKGAINWIQNKEGINSYGIVPLVAGFLDYQINRLSKEFASDFDQYMDEGFMSKMLENGILQLRTVPIEKSIPMEYNISNFDEIKNIVENIKGTIYLSPCICRQLKDVQGKGCEHPLETCITIGRNPRILLEQGRIISKEEAFDVLRMSQENGLVICPTNAQKPFMICSCCGCSCMFLENLKKYENPARFVNSNYFISVNDDKCAGCGDCISVCPMNANKVNENMISKVDLGSCIGCGVCIPRCPENARRLVKKEKEVIPPKNFTELYQTISQRKALVKEKRKVDKNYNRVKKIK